MISALVCLSQFKNHLSNTDATRIVSEALARLEIPSRRLPVGDGGAGTLDAVQTSLGGVIETIATQNPLGNQALARVLCLPDVVNPATLYIESAETCGLRESDRDALRASSYGLGDLLAKCLDAWRPSLRKIYIGLGDSATSDMGMGMLHALGYQFLDAAGKKLWGNAQNLGLVRSIRPPSPEPFRGVKFTILCDVTNPLCGPLGAARVFSPQKGASPEDVKLIESGIENLAQLVEKQTGKHIGLAPLSGAAGGLAAALHVFLKAELVQGARFLLDWLHFDALAQQHTVVVTGEGRTDAQTLAGKAPQECIVRAAKVGRKAVVISGALGEGYEPLREHAALFACGSAPTARDALFRKTLEVFSSPEVLTSLKGS